MAALHVRARRAADAPAQAAEPERHWRLWRAEPWLGLAVIAAAAALVAFPLPPRQLDDAGRAQAAVCDPCPLPRPAADELAVADAAGSQVVAAWIRRTPEAVTGTVRVLDSRGRPSRVPVELAGDTRRLRRRAAAASGCPPARRTVDVAVRESGPPLRDEPPRHVGDRRQRPRAAAARPRAEATMRWLRRRPRAGAAHQRARQRRHHRVPPAPRPTG